VWKKKGAKDSVPSPNARAVRSNKNKIQSATNINKRAVRSNVATASLNDSTSTRLEETATCLDVSTLRGKKCISCFDKRATSTHSGIPSKHMRAATSIDGSHNFLAQAVIRETCKRSREGKRDKCVCYFHFSSIC